jgi:hypothetical protein
MHVESLQLGCVGVCGIRHNTNMYLMFSLSIFCMPQAGQMQPAMLLQQSLVRTPVRSSPSKAASRASRKLNMTCRATTSTERQPRRDNVGLEKENAVFVDHTCIDCDTCR